MDIHDNTLLVGMANRLNYVYDIRKLDEPIQRRDSSLKFMTRCIKLTPLGDGSPLAVTLVNGSIRIILH
jgi:cell cycle arrest protein BUB3